MGEKKKPAQHQALYRKYRSKSLDEIVGQEHITKTLANAIKQGKISHAYLFTGPRGTGKTSIARILAHEINNLPYTDDSTNLDIIEIDAASNRRIDDIRDLREKVNIAPVAAKYKVYIIDEVHMLTTESFNALLKTLEEPPQHVVFILATTEVHKLPATIMSRTQRHAFRLISSEKVIAHLKTIAKKEHIAIDDEALELLAEHGEGSFRDSISLLDQMSAIGDHITKDTVELLLGLAAKDRLSALLQASEAGDNKQVLEEIESLIEAGLTPAAIANQLLKYLRNAAKNGEASAHTVQLMKELLTVSNAQYPQLKLETILLAINTQKSSDTASRAGNNTLNISPVTKGSPAPSKNEAVNEAPKTAEKTTTLPLETEDSSSNEVTPEKAAPSPVEATKKAKQSTPNGSARDLVLPDDWQKALENIKQKNNPLYTVLRLAKPELNGDTLTLYFAFPFHQKKADELKNKKLLAEAIAEICTQTLQIITKVDKEKLQSNSADISHSAKPDTAHASLISNVQDIMGGGEVVDI